MQSPFRRLLAPTLGLTLTLGAGLAAFGLYVWSLPGAPTLLSPLPGHADEQAVPARPEAGAPPAQPAAAPVAAPVPPTPVVALASPDVFALNEGVAVRMSQRQMGRVQVVMLTGGQPVSRHVLWRSSVGEFVRAAGAVAGVNGTFFKDAAIASNDSNMLGPLLTPDGHFLSETDPAQLRKIVGRPLVAWSRGQFLVTGFDPQTMNRKAQVQALLPGVTDAFLAGGWLVHGGHALSPAALLEHAPSDAQQVRPRVFFGVTRAGLVIAGATTTPVSSSRLAQVAEEAGAQEAVLMDSGYSTSLIYGSRVLAVGHKSRKVASRPVPHAIVFMNPVLAAVKPARP